MTITETEAESIIIFANAPGIEVLIRLQDLEISKQKGLQLGLDKRSTIEDFVQGAGTIRGMERMSFKEIYKIAKITLEKIRNDG